MIAQRNWFPRRAVGCLGAALLLAALAACSGGSPPSVTPASPSDGPIAHGTPSELPTSQPSPTVSPLDLTEIVISSESPPRGMTFSSGEEGRQVLDRLPLSPDTAAQLKAQSGFVDGRSTAFAGSAEDFEASKGFILTWVARYASQDDAAGAFSILLNELQSDDHYGWGIGADAGLGDEGTCLEGDNPQLGGLHETICLWRHGPLVMIVGGGSENETPIQTDAEVMDARASALRQASTR